jgi:hypothetical protein
MGKEKEACWSCMHGRPTASSSQPRPLSCFALCSFSRSLC